MSDEQKIQIIEIAELPKVIHAYESGDGRGWDENAWAHPISCTIAEYHRVDVAPSPAINQELFTLQRQYANAQRNFEYYYDLYRKVSGKTIAECEKQWSVDTIDGQIGLEKHAAAVKHSQEK